MAQDRPPGWTPELEAELVGLRTVVTQPRPQGWTEDLEAELNALRPDPTIGQYAAQAGLSFAQGLGNAVEDVARLQPRLLSLAAETVLPEDVASTIRRGLGVDRPNLSALIPNIPEVQASESGLANFASTTGASAFGSIAPSIATAGLGSAAGLGARGVAALGAGVGASMGGGAGLREAQEAGAGTAEQWGALAVNSVLGTADSLVPSRIVHSLARLDAASGGTLKRLAVRGMATTEAGAGEAVTEAIEQLGSDLYAKGTFDPERDMEGWKEGAAGGGFAGTVASLLMQGASRARRAGVKPGSVSADTGTIAQTGVSAPPPAPLDLTGAAPPVAEQLESPTPTIPASSVPGGSFAGGEQVGVGTGRKASAQTMGLLQAGNPDVVFEEVEPTTPEAAYVREFAKQRNLGVTFVRSKGKAARFPAVAGNGDMVLSADRPLTGLLYHETLHNLPAEDRADLIGALRTIDPEGQARLEQYYREQAGNEGAGLQEEGAAMRAEVEAGVLYQALQDPKKLARALEFKPGLWQRLLDAIGRVFGRDSKRTRMIRALHRDVGGEKSLDAEKSLKIAQRLAQVFEGFEYRSDTAQTDTLPTVVEGREPTFEESLADPEIRASLEMMASEAGWSEVGGQPIRHPETREFIGKTKWVPHAEWWPNRPRKADGSYTHNEKQVKRIVAKALEGKRKLTEGEQRLIDWMIHNSAPAESGGTKMDWESVRDLEQRGEAFDEDAPPNVPVEGVPFSVAPRRIIGYDLTGEPVYEEKPKETPKEKPAAKREVQHGMFTPKQKQAFDLGDTEVERSRGKYAVAWHGSPFEFDEFKSEKIGTGEGAQAYGHGLYFTDKREIAEHYRKKLSSPARTIENKAADSYEEGYSPEDAANALMSRTDFSPSERALLVALQNDGWLGFDYPHQAVRAILGKDAGNLDASPETTFAANAIQVERKGRTYQVDLAPADDEYLLWDKPLSEQSEKVKAALRPVLDGSTWEKSSWPQTNYALKGSDGQALLWREKPVDVWSAFTGETAYKVLLNTRNPAESSSKARSLGIRGIKYLDGSSRSKGEGAYNYVIFDPADVKITGKYSVGSEAFKRWFGDSKVVDADGKPLRLYRGERDLQPASGPVLRPDHDIEINVPSGPFGTSYPLKRNMPKRASLSFTPDARVANVYSGRVAQFNDVVHGERANAGEFYLKITNPVDLRYAQPPNSVLDPAQTSLSKFIRRTGGFDAWPRSDVKTLLEALERETSARLTESYNLKKNGRIVLSELNKKNYDGAMSAASGVRFDQFLVGDSQAIVNLLVARGYDGVIHADALRGGLSGRFIDESTPTRYDTYRPFGSSQIKSATGNRGTFDPSNPDIRYSVGSEGFSDFKRGTHHRLVDSFRPLIETGPGVEEAVRLRPGLVFDELSKADEQIATPMREAMNAGDISIEEASQYLYALHAPVRNAIIAERSGGKRGLESKPGSGMRNSEAAAIVAAAEKKNRAAFHKIRDLNRKLNVMRLDALESGGLLSAEQRAEWEKFGPDYVPLATVNDPEEQYVGSAASHNVRGPESKRAEGRDTLADTPLLQNFERLEGAISRKYANRVGQELADVVEANPSDDWKVVKSKPDDPWLTMSFKRDGEQYYIATKNEELHRAFGAMDIAKSGPILKLVKKANAYLRAVTTSHNPFFFAPNILKDATAGALKGYLLQDASFGARIARDAIPAALGIARGKGQWKAIYDEVRAEGGIVGWKASENFQERLDSWKKELKGRNAFQRFVHGLSVLGSAIEAGTRVATYKAARERGMSKRRSAMLSRDITVDFAKHGNWSRNLSTAYLYFNANVQGTESIVRAMRQNPGKAAKLTSALFTAGFLSSLASRLLSDEEENGMNAWDMRNEGDKQRRIGIQVGESHIGIPAAWGFNAIWYAGQRAEEAMFGRERSGAAGDLTLAALQAFSPLQGSTALQVVAPTVTRPAAEILENKDFTGRSIRPEPSPFDNTPPPRSEQHFDDVTPAIKGVTDWLNSATGGNRVRGGLVSISPEDVEHFLKAIGGGVSSNVVRAINAENLSEAPIVRTFMSNLSRGATYSLFKENRERVAYAVEEKKAKVEVLEPDMLKLSDALRSAESRIRNLRATRRSQPDKAEEYDRRIEEIMQAFNRKVLAK